jgi:hypothetical protein
MENQKDWSIYGLRGLRQVVKDKLKADPKLPQFAKDFLIAELEGLPADCLGAAVDAYGTSFLTAHNVTRSISVSVVGIKL